MNQWTRPAQDAFEGEQQKGFACPGHKVVLCNSFFARVAQRAGGIEALAGFPHALLEFHGRAPRGRVAKRLRTKSEARHQIVKLIYHFPQRDGTFPAGAQLLYPCVGDRKALPGTPVGVRLYHGDRCRGRGVWRRSSCAMCSRKRALRRSGPPRRVQGCRATHGIMRCVS